MFRHALPTLVLVAATLPAWAVANVSYQKFSWRANGHFDLQLTESDQAVVLSGDLRDGESVRVKSGDLTADVQSYIEGFVTIALGVEDQATGVILVLERSNNQFLLLNNQVLVDSKATMVQDLHDIVVGLKQNKNWDASQSFRALDEYARRNPGKPIFYFAQDVASNLVTSVPKPVPPGLSRDSAVSASVTPPLQINKYADAAPSDMNSAPPPVETDDVIQPAVDPYQPPAGFTPMAGPPDFDFQARWQTWWTTYFPGTAVPPAPRRGESVRIPYRDGRVIPPPPSYSGRDEYRPIPPATIRNRVR